ncbi:hypothetical protein V6N11_063654 [Hibiscus sabdariffa]|uniref:Uncharacterized protein n=2 Tax=Hibiscus sabdariffa TaxID=183260 RepID=A0ABR2B510_9ROSI
MHEILYFPTLVNTESSLNSAMLGHAMARKPSNGSNSLRIYLPNPEAPSSFPTPFLPYATWDHRGEDSKFKVFGGGLGKGEVSARLILDNGEVMVKLG